MKKPAALNGIMVLIERRNLLLTELQVINEQLEIVKNALNGHLGIRKNATPGSVRTRILDAITHPMTTREISRATGYGIVTVQTHLKTLAETGLLARTRVPREPGQTGRSTYKYISTKEKS